jgi:hypothetical protein
MQMVCSMYALNFSGLNNITISIPSGTSKFLETLLYVQIQADSGSFMHSFIILAAMAMIECQLEC